MFYAYALTVISLLYGSLNLSPVSSDIGMRQNKLTTND